MGSTLERVVGVDIGGLHSVSWGIDAQLGAKMTTESTAVAWFTLRTDNQQMYRPALFKRRKVCWSVTTASLAQNSGHARVF